MRQTLRCLISCLVIATLLWSAHLCAQQRFAPAGPAPVEVSGHRSPQVHHAHSHAHPLEAARDCDSNGCDQRGSRCPATGSVCCQTWAPAVTRVTLSAPTWEPIRGGLALASAFATSVSRFAPDSRVPTRASPSDVVRPHQELLATPNGDRAPPTLA